MSICRHFGNRPETDEAFGFGFGLVFGVCFGIRFMMLFNIRFMWIYALQVHAERQHINFMAIEARQKELQQQRPLPTRIRRIPNLSNTQSPHS